LDYIQGSAWRYGWFMPQDEAGLIRLLGGDMKVIAKLDASRPRIASPATTTSARCPPGWCSPHSFLSGGTRVE